MIAATEVWRAAGRLVIKSGEALHEAGANAGDRDAFLYLTGKHEGLLMAARVMNELGDELYHAQMGQAAPTGAEVEGPPDPSHEHSTAGV